jgi:hypothetical protein
MKGDEYADLIAAYVLQNYGCYGVLVYREVPLGKTIIGKNRRIDILCVQSATARVLALECKYQNVQGTADEKIPYALADLKAMHVPAFAIYAGNGFSQGVLHLLQASELAAHCMPEPSLEPNAATTELDHVIAMTFGFWQGVLRTRKPFDLGQWREKAAREHPTPTPPSS